MESVIPKTLRVKNKFNLEAKFIKVTCGHSHNMAIDHYGTLYSWGDGSMGCLGHQDEGF